MRSSSAVTPRTKLVCLANPNNPTGTYLPFDEIKRLRAGLPPHVLLVLDAAYSEYVYRNDYEVGLELVAHTENTVMLHTFSNIYGLAALRRRLDVRAGATSSTPSTASAAPSTSRRRGCWPAAAALEDPAHIQTAKRAQRQMARLADGRDRQARPEGDAERG